MSAASRWSLSRRPVVRALTAAVLSLGAVALVSGAIFALEPVAPVLSLGVLYLFAVLPVAAIWGLPFALPVSIVSMLAFNWLFLEPRHTFRLADSENWVALAVYLVTAVSVSGLAARARRRAAEAEQRRREATLAAEVSAILLESREVEVEAELPEIAARIARLLGASWSLIELDPASPRAPGESVYELVAGERRVGRLVLDPAADPSPEVVARVLSVVASLLATAIEREQLARDARESEARRRSEAIEAEALRRSDAVKTAVLRSVSHDLRSPITAIMAASDLLEGSGEALSPSEGDELLTSIQLQVRRLDRLVSNLLDLSRLEADAARPARELWTMDGLVARALDVVGSESQRVDVVLPPDSPPVSVDPTQLEHALVNLLENSLKFSAPVDRVRVEVEHMGGEVLVRLTDRGPGIPSQEHARIFEPFVRGTSADGERGSGLGLAIARGFAQVNGGRLWVESTPGDGSTFVLALPAVDTAAPIPT